MSKQFKSAIVVGASSGIGEALARRLAGEGCRVALVARRAAQIQSLAGQINTHAQATLAYPYPHDARDVAGVPELFAQITRDLGGLDLIVYAAGLMPRIPAGQYATALDADAIAVNFTGAVAWLNEAAQRMEKARAGTIVGISSVAGDRGRRGNAVYGATKAALNSYLESLYNRLATKGVAVVTIKPGPVDTPMTAGLRMPGMASVDGVADEIMAAMHAGPRIAYTPTKWRIIMAVLRAIPAPLFKYLPI